MDQIEINLEGGNLGGLPEAVDNEANKQKPMTGAGNKQTDKMALNLNQFIFKKSTHPLTCLFHLLFKALAIFIYMFTGYIFQSVTIFIFVCLSTAFDFWTVKNVSGRLLVGLRWWTVVDENGKEKWTFECYDHQTHNSVFDSYVFWWSQFGATVFWALIFFLKIITFSFFWGTLSFICLFLTGLNLYGYFKCNKQHQKTLKSTIDGVAKKVFYQAVMNKIGL